ncbi:DUF6233 domain-containing protein [Streptomyces zhihengii]|uniref:Uncharacterized protein n=1 Tax=Streptomyces zhihengii TaxID=1818004 RepID=A0ABS2V2C3_9ACTN|nr:DUF6233 domain-containing protein [Streptomyces zhihengii]MBM9623992.1 hypothetical protein [Streptomyces zhihengii]
MQILSWVRERIADLERQDRERRAGEERRRPPVPAWVIETGIGADRPRPYVHVGGCHMAGCRVYPAAREEAAAAAADGVEACTHCQADTLLGRVG